VLTDRDVPGFESGVAENDRLWSAIWKLPVDQRAVIVLRHVEDRSEDETAEILGVRTGTVKSRLARGLAALRRELEVVGTDEVTDADAIDMAALAEEPA